MKFLENNRRTSTASLFCLEAACLLDSKSFALCKNTYSVIYVA
jgi:hypothetical protein